MKYLGQVHHEINKYKTPTFRYDLFKIIWKYLIKDPQRINKNLFSKLFLDNIISEKDLIYLVTSKNFNPACQFACEVIKNPKFNYFYCSHCPFELNFGNIDINKCPINAFSEYNKLISQLEFNQIEFNKRYSCHIGYLEYRPYEMEIERIKNQIKDVIIHKILKLKIRYSYFNNCHLYVLIDYNI